jgi:hypothetical protein
MGPDLRYSVHVVWETSMAKPETLVTADVIIALKIRYISIKTLPLRDPIGDGFIVEAYSPKRFAKVRVLLKEGVDLIYPGDLRENLDRIVQSKDYSLEIYHFSERHQLRNPQYMGK